MPISHSDLSVSLPAILDPSLGDLAWAENQKLFRWSPLLDDRPSATEDQDTIPQQDVTDWSYDRLGLKDGEYPDRPGLKHGGESHGPKPPKMSAQELRDRVWPVAPVVFSSMAGDNPPGFQDHIGPVPISYARPNAIGADIAYEQRMGKHPYAGKCDSLSLEWLSNWDVDQSALTDGAYWVAGQLTESLKFTVPRSIIETIGPSGTGQVLKEHLRSRFVDADIDGILDALKADCDRLKDAAKHKLGLISYEAILWAEAGQKPVFNPEGEVIEPLSLVNLATALTGLQKLKKLGDAVNSFAQGVNKAGAELF